MRSDSGLIPASILLPAPGIDLQKWAVVACDQFTSQPDYWARVRSFVADAPSTLKMIQPEIDLDRAEENIPAINAEMRAYLEKGILRTRVEDGFIVVERTTDSGVRLGLMACVDLEDYDFTPGARALIRATEETIAARVPPRVRIRRDAPLEAPHVMLLIDDPGFTAVEAAYAASNTGEALYDFELMEGGGHLRGWKVANPDALLTALSALRGSPDDFLYVAGDGNHSLATAKACWEEIRPSLTETEKARHPARFALVEIVNLHSPALAFEPIHRVIFGVDAARFVSEVRETLRARGFRPEAGGEIRFISENGESGIRLDGAGELLPVAALQPALDEYLAAHPGARIDYVHGEAAVRELSRTRDTVGILLTSIPKRALFPAVRAGGVLPRKTFSMGEAQEKRYYMECRRIR